MLGDLEGLILFIPFVYLGFALVAYLAVKNKFQP